MEKWLDDVKKTYGYGEDDNEQEDNETEEDNEIKGTDEAS